jgi:hypothetical protein
MNRALAKLRVFRYVIKSKERAPEEEIVDTVFDR